MRDLDYLKKRAPKFDLEADYLNYDTLKVYSPKFFFDSWLIKVKDNEIELWHMSKKNNLKKCSYHLQSVVQKGNGVKLLKKIKNHNEYTAFHKRYRKINLVDRILNGGQSA